MLLWIPKHKRDPEGKGIVLLLKLTYDECCPIKLTLKLVKESKGSGPIFITPTRVPLQSWLLKWVRRRMTEIGKKPELYGLRSIRQGATSRAQDIQMPEIFLRDSGGWKGRAMDAYSKDCLPGEQKRFAKRLGRNTDSNNNKTKNARLHQSC